MACTQNQPNLYLPYPNDGSSAGTSLTINGHARKYRTRSTDFCLDSFPKEVLDNVMHVFSRLPKAKNCDRHIPLVGLVPLFRVNGQVETMMKTRFTALCVSISGDCVTDTNIGHWKRLAEGFFRQQTKSTSRVPTY